MFEWVFAQAHTDMTPLTKPLTREEMQERADQHNYITGTVAVSSEVLTRDLEERMDAIAEALTGSPLLMDIGYTIVGLNDKETLALEVSGDISAIIEEEWDE